MDSNLLFSILGHGYDFNDLPSRLSHDMFTPSIRNFIRYCIDETAKALQLAVVYTHKQATETQQKKFYLVGFEERPRWATYSRKIYGNPETEGKSIKWLLRNVRWHKTKYAKNLELYDDALEDITSFLLYDIVQEEYGETKTEIYSDQFLLAQDVFEACDELVSAVYESKYYESISSQVEPFKQNIETLPNLLSDFQQYQKKQQEAASSKLDTIKVLDFLQNKNLLKSLEAEKNIKSDDPKDKPLTNYFLFTVMPRFEKQYDSGIMADETLEQPLQSTAMDGSMVIIDSMHSTPFAKNKTVERLKRFGETKSPKQKSKEDKMDGSFLVI